MTPCLKIVTVHNINRVNNMDLLTVAKFFFGYLPHYGIHVNGINRSYIRVFVKHSADCPEHMVHRFTKIFPSVCGNENHTVITNPFQFLMVIVFRDSITHSVNDGISRDKNRICVFALLQQMLLCQCGRSKMILTDNPYCLSVELFGIGRVNVISPQSRLNMTYRNL